LPLRGNRGVAAQELKLEKSVTRQHSNIPVYYGKKNFNKNKPNISLKIR